MESTSGGRLSATVQGPFGDGPRYQTASLQTQYSSRMRSTESGVLTAKAIAVPSMGLNWGSPS